MNIRQKPVEALRYERKFAIEAESIKSLYYLVKLQPALFTESFEERRVNSIYFDTDDYSYYQDTAFGKADRHKVRLRWYGNDLETIHDGNIEIKSKSGFVSAKDVFYLGDFATKDLLAHYQTYIDAAETLDESCKLLFRFLRPIILVSYARRYFVSADKNFRITLDYDLCFYDLRSTFNLQKKVSSDVTVLELKYAYEHDALARTITTLLPNRYSRSSKYRIGLESI
jgi:SPX domain protein involved in polyphosphate accumulation